MAPTLISGIRLGRYEVEAPIGSGATGDVYRARDTQSDRQVALKILSDALTGDTTQLARFTNEARTIALITHPNIVAVYDVGCDAGRPFVVSELLTGEPLRARIGRGRLPASIAARDALEIAHGLIAAHHLGVVHRDLRPENVFVTDDGRLKILDFGLARCGHEAIAISNGHRNAAEPATTPGSISYMAPERARGGIGDERSDIFSLGAILYEMIAGAPPFAAETAIEVLYPMTKRVPRLLPSDAEVPPDLEHAIRHCLEHQAAARFQSARDLAFVLEFTLRAPQVTRRPAPAWRMFDAMRRRL